MIMISHRADISKFNRVWQFPNTHFNPVCTKPIIKYDWEDKCVIFKDNTNNVEFYHLEIPFSFYFKLYQEIKAQSQQQLNPGL